MSKTVAPQHIFELYILSDQLTENHWTLLNKAIIGHMGMFGGRSEENLRIDLLHSRA